MASKGKYLETVEQTIPAPTDSTHILAAHFTASKADTYYIYARVLCPTWDDDSYFVSVDGALNSNFVNGLQTASWEWKEIYHGNLQAGQHTLYIGGREDGACLDKLCITTNPEAPSGMGGNPTPTAITELSANNSSTVSIEHYSLSGIRLTTPPTTGMYIEVRRADDGSISRKVVRGK